MQKVMWPFFSSLQELLLMGQYKDRLLVAVSALGSKKRIFDIYLS